MESRQIHAGTPSEDAMSTDPLSKGSSSTRTDKETTPLNLPLEVVLIIIDNLPVDAIVALQLYHIYFKECDSIQLILERKLKTQLNDCAKLFARTYERDLKGIQATSERCIICKHRYPVAQFYSSGSSTCLQNPPPNPSGRTFKEIVAMPPRTCNQHVGRLMRVVPTGPGGRNEWVSTVKHICVHCGKIKEWDPCNCKCDTCWTRPVWTYTRYWGSDKKYGEYRFWRRHEASTYRSKDGLPGSLFVREPLRENDTTFEPYCDLPVHFRDNDPEPDSFPLPSRKLSAKL